jgi:hypothetical protein
MSEYLIENGGPIIPGKNRYNYLERKPSVVSYSKKIAYDKMRF